MVRKNVRRRKGRTAPGFDTAGNAIRYATFLPSRGRVMLWKLVSVARQTSQRFSPLALNQLAHDAVGLAAEKVGGRCHAQGGKHRLPEIAEPDVLLYQMSLMANA